MLTHSARTSNKQSFSSSGEDLWQWAQRSEASSPPKTDSVQAESERSLAGWARALLWLRGIRKPVKSSARNRRGGGLL